MILHCCTQPRCVRSAPVRYMDAAAAFRCVMMDSSTQQYSSSSSYRGEILSPFSRMAAKRTHTAVSEMSECHLAHPHHQPPTQTQPIGERKMFPLVLATYEVFMNVRDFHDEKLRQKHSRAPVSPGEPSIRRATQDPNVSERDRATARSTREEGKYCCRPQNQVPSFDSYCT